MTERPKTIARATGLFYLALLATGVFAQGFIADKLIVAGDAATTAANILANRCLYETAFTVYMAEMACQIAVTVLFYRLLRPVNKSAALLAMAWGLTGCVIKTGGRVFFLAPLFLLPDAASTHYLRVFSAEQLQAMSLVFITVNNRAAGMGLAFFGFCDTLNGWLIFKSTFLPRWLGVLTLLGGLGWMTFAHPPLGQRLFLPLALYGLAASLVVIGWLLIKGVDEEKWKAVEAVSRS
jgi:Domain of unknown function (DUF4386)